MIASLHFQPCASVRAVRNMIVRGSPDLGAVTMGIVAVAAAVEKIQGRSNFLNSAQVVGSVLAAFNFALPLIFWSKMKKMFAKSKSALWMTIFKSYCQISIIFWLVGAYYLSKIDKNSS